MENKDFDKWIRKRLENVQPEFDPGDWDRMEEELDNDERESKELLYFKGMEIAIVLLVVLTLFRYYPDSTPVADYPFQQGTEVITPQERTSSNGTSTNSDVLSDAQDKVALADNHSNARNTETGNIDSDIQSPVQSISTVTHSNTTLSSQQNNSISNTIYTDIPVSNHTNTETFEKVPSTENKALSPITIQQLSLDNKLEVATLEENVVLETSSILETIKMLDVEVSPMAQEQMQIPVQLNKPEFRLSYSMGLDWNNIVTPYDMDTGSSFSQGNLGFSSALTASIKKNRWEFETGLGYTRNAYNPVPVYEVTGSSREGYEAQTLNNLTFNILRIPLNARFFIRKSSNPVNFYISTGANLNAVAWSNYSRYTYQVKEETNLVDVLEGRQPKDVVSKNAGFFNDETIGENFFITAHLGFGMESRINEKTSFFLQPKYTFYLMPGTTGLGPNNDQFNSLSFDLGLRYKF